MDSLATSSDVFSVALINNLEVLLEDLEAALRLIFAELETVLPNGFCANLSGLLASLTNGAATQL